MVVAICHENLVAEAAGGKRKYAPTVIERPPGGADKAELRGEPQSSRMRPVRVRKKAKKAQPKRVARSGAKARANPRSSVRVTSAPAAPVAAQGRARRRPSPAELLERLDRAIPRPHVELAFRDPWQLLVAVILSAQSTDRRVNLVTPELFRRWPTPRALAEAEPADVEEVIKSTGFFRNKAKAIRGASSMLVERFSAQVPRSMPELLGVPGVARKTANVVLGSAFGIASGVVTDTHAMRVARRLALTRHEEPEKIEVDLCKLFPRETWIKLGHRLVLHGRYVCTARAPDCTRCPLNELCPSRLTKPEATWEVRAAREAEDMERRAEGFVRP